MRVDIQTKFEAWQNITSKNLTYMEFDLYKEQEFPDFTCIECGLDNNKYAYLIGYKEIGSFYEYKKPKLWELPKLKDCSISYIASDNSPYNKFFNKNLQQQDFISHNIVFYGQTDNKVSNIIYKQFPINMAEARNLSINIAETDYIFLLDVDTYGSITEYNRILKEYGNIYHHGVLNLRCKIDPNNQLAGNSLYFASKEIYKRNSFFEEFKGFFFEDTEYMLNWTRVGNPITILDINFKREWHPVIEKKMANMNLPLFKNCLINGR